MCCWNHLDDPLVMAVAKPLLIEFDINRSESCVRRLKNIKYVKITKLLFWWIDLCRSDAIAKGIL